MLSEQNQANKTEAACLGDEVLSMSGCLREKKCYACHQSTRRTEEDKMEVACLESHADIAREFQSFMYEPLNRALML